MCCRKRQPRNGHSGRRGETQVPVQGAPVIQGGPTDWGRLTTRAHRCPDAAVAGTSTRRPGAADKPQPRGGPRPRPAVLAGPPVALVFEPTPGAMSVLLYAAKAGSAVSTPGVGWQVPLTAGLRPGPLPVLTALGFPGSGNSEDGTVWEELHVLHVHSPPVLRAGGGAPLGSWEGSGVPRGRVCPAGRQPQTLAPAQPGCPPGLPTQGPHPKLLLAPACPSPAFQEVFLD